MSDVDRTEIVPASPSDLDETVACLTAAFSRDPITGFLLQRGPEHPQRVAQFFSLLMRARMSLGMPVLVARDTVGIRGAAMGYATAPPSWPPSLAQEWDRFERAIPGFSDRIAVYDEIARNGTPPVPHYYLGVIGSDPSSQGRGIGTRLLESFCDLSASDPRSHGVFLETATPENLRFYARAGFMETGRGSLGSSTLWCMFLAQEPRKQAA